MRHLRLARLEPSHEQRLALDSDYQVAMAEDDWNLLAKVMQRVVGDDVRSSSTIESAHPDWGGYLALDDSTSELIGSCAFKAPPTSDGVIEIAYFTYPGFEGQGYATLMARKLVELAKASSRVRRVIAHTLPAKNASTRVLEKAGMQFVGEVIDPDDGRVWRWEVQVGV